MDVDITASSHLADQAKRPNPKLLSKGEDKSPLNYIISVLLSNSEYFIEKMFGLLTNTYIYICICVCIYPSSISIFSMVI